MKYSVNVSYSTNNPTWLYSIVYSHNGRVTHCYCCIKQHPQLFSKQQCSGRCFCLDLNISPRNVSSPYESLNTADGKGGGLMGMGINPSFVAEPQSCTHYRHNRPCVHVLNCTYSVLYTQTYMLYFCMYWYMFGIYMYITCMNHFKLSHGCMWPFSQAWTVCNSVYIWFTQLCMYGDLVWSSHKSCRSTATFWSLLTYHVYRITTF